MIKVNNTYPGSTLPTVVATTGTPTQIYRNTNNTIFKPTLIIVTNITATAAHRLMLVDCDLSDVGEDTYKDEAYVLLDINVGASETEVLSVENGKLPEGLMFRYGVAGYVTDATLDVKVFVEGTEHFLTTTE